jgi:hypothetical protein
VPRRERRLSHHGHLLAHREVDSASYAVGAVYALLVWAVGEGFDGPYQSGATDIGTGIVYTMLFLTLLVFSPPARRERRSLDEWPVTRRSGGRLRHRDRGWTRRLVVSNPGSPDLLSGEDPTGKLTA